MIVLSKEAKSAQIENSNETSLPFLPEADISDMDYFLDQIKLILPLMGFRFLIPSVIKTNVSQETINSLSIEVYKIKHSTIHAKMYEDDKGYIVLKGSQANKNLSSSISGTYVNLRKKLIEEGTLVDKGDFYEFAEDTVFESISPPSNIVLGRQSNGNIEWLNETGKTYKERQADIYKA